MKKRGNYKFELFLIILFLLSINIVFADTLPIHVRPLSSGLIQATTAFDYRFDFTSNQDCSTVLHSATATITTDAYGLGFTEIDLTPLNDTPSYLCEYRAASGGALALRKVHNTSTGLFNRTFGKKAYIEGNLTTTGNITLADRINFKLGGYIKEITGWFVFSQSVNVDGNINVTGDINVTGYVNASTVYSGGYNVTTFADYNYNMTDGSYNATYDALNSTYEKFWYNYTGTGDYNYNQTEAVLNIDNLNVTNELNATNITLTNLFFYTADLFKKIWTSPTSGINFLVNSTNGFVFYIGNSESSYNETMRINDTAVYLNRSLRSPTIFSGGINLTNFAYNMSDGSYNVSYANYAYNYTGTGDYYYNQSSDYDYYNQSTASTTMHNDSWSSTYNESYADYAYNYTGTGDYYYNMSDGSYNESYVTQQETRQVNITNHLNVSNLNVSSYVNIGENITTESFISKGFIGSEINSLRDWWAFRYATGLGVDDTGLFFDVSDTEMEMWLSGVPRFFFGVGTGDLDMNGSLTLGSFTNNDPTITMRGEDNSGVLQWREDEAKFESDSDFGVQEGKKFYLNSDSATPYEWIASLTTNMLNLNALTQQNFSINSIRKFFIDSTGATVVGALDVKGNSVFENITATNASFKGALLGATVYSGGYNVTTFADYNYNMTDGSYNATYIWLNTTYHKFWYNMSEAVLDVDNLNVTTYLNATEIFTQSINATKNITIGIAQAPGSGMWFGDDYNASIYWNGTNLIIEG